MFKRPTEQFLNSLSKFSTTSKCPKHIILEMFARFLCFSIVSRPFITRSFDYSLLLILHCLLLLNFLLFIVYSCCYLILMNFLRNFCCATLETTWKLYWWFLIKHSVICENAQNPTTIWTIFSHLIMHLINNWAMESSEVISEP